MVARQFAALALALTLLLSGPALALTDEERDAALYEAGTAALAACVDEDMTDVEKLTALHDWLALRCDYGATLRGATAYGALVEGTANCVGYAEGLAYLATLAGLDGEATYSEALDHAWISARLDGEMYFCDCTWDDGKNQKLGLIRHKYLLFDENNAAEKGHLGWDTERSVPGGALEDAPWTAAVTRVIFFGAWAYYIDGDFTLWRCARDGWEAEPLARLGEPWPDDDPDDAVPELYTSLIFMGRRLYYNTAEAICSVDLSGGNARTLLTPALTDDRLVYGLGVQDGRLCYSLAASPDALTYDIVGTRLSARFAWGLTFS